jgi:hypothetical protein
LNVTISLIDHQMTMQQAIDALRTSGTGTGSSVTLDPRFP